MIANHKFHGVLSLSAASVALSQSMSAKGQPLDQTMTGSTGPLNAQNASKTAHLVLAPVHHEELVRLYADHASHASHSSHASHYSGSDYSVPVAPSSPTLSYPETPSQPQQAQTNAATPVSETNSVNEPVPAAVSTNSTNQTVALNTTNAPVEETSESDRALLDFLKKRAAEGSADAQYALAIDYLYGHNGVRKDENTAELLLEMSASQGNTMAKEKIEQLKQSAKGSGTDSK